MHCCFNNDISVCSKKKRYSRILYLISEWSSPFPCGSVLSRSLWFHHRSITELLFTIISCVRLYSWGLHFHSPTPIASCLVLLPMLPSRQTFCLYCSSETILKASVSSPDPVSSICTLMHQQRLSCSTSCIFMVFIFTFWNKIGVISTICSSTHPLATSIETWCITAIL